MSISPRKIISVFTVSLYFVGQVALGSAAETNFWSERRRSASTPQPKPQQLAALPTSTNNPLFNTNSFLQQLPSVDHALSLNQNSNRSTSKHIPHLSTKFQSLLDSISLAYGSVQEVYDSHNPEPPVVLVQDIHLNAEAQTNIAALLQELIDQKQIGLVGVEGAFTPFDFKPFRAFAEKQIVKDVTEKFVEKNLLAAPSYVGITSAVEPPPFLGVDDKEHYAKNVRAYLDSREIKKQTTQRLEELAQHLQAEKAKVFSPDLLRFDALRTAHYKNDVSFGTYVKKLTTYGIESDFVIDQFLSAYDMESALDFEKVEEQRRAVIEKLTKVLSEKEITELVAESVAYRMGKLGFGDYYQNLKDLCRKKGINLAQFPAFDDYIRYVLLSDGIKADALFSAVTRLEKNILGLLAKSPEEKKLAAQSEELSLMNKLTEFALTPNEWTEYKILTHGPLTIDQGPNLSPFERFYSEADTRSELLLKNFQQVPHYELPAVLVVGGFHTPQVAELLRKQKISYIVVSPKITKIDDDAGSAYLSVFAREKTPLDQLFAGEKLFLCPDTEHITNANAAVPLLAAETSQITNVDPVTISWHKRLLSVTVPKNFLEIDQYKIRAFLTHPFTAVFTETGLLWLAATWAKGFIGAAALTDPTGLLLVVAVGMGLLFSLAHEDLWDKNISWLEFGNRLGQRFVAGFVFSSLFLFASINWAVVANIVLHGTVNGGKLLNLPFLRRFNYLNITVRPYPLLGRSDFDKLYEDTIAETMVRALISRKIKQELSDQDVLDWVQGLHLQQIVRAEDATFPGRSAFIYELEDAREQRFEVLFLLSAEGIPFVTALQGGDGALRDSFTNSKYFTVSELIGNALWEELSKLQSRQNIPIQESPKAWRFSPPYISQTDNARAWFEGYLHLHPIVSGFVKLWFDRGIKVYPTRRFAVSTAKRFFSAFYQPDRKSINRGSGAMFDSFAHEFIHAVFDALSEDAKIKIENHFQTHHPELADLFTKHPSYIGADENYATEGLAYYLEMALFGNRTKHLGEDITLTLNPEVDIKFFYDIGVITEQLRDEMLAAYKPETATPDNPQTDDTYQQPITFDWTKTNFHQLIIPNHFNFEIPVAKSIDWDRLHNIIIQPRQDQQTTIQSKPRIWNFLTHPITAVFTETGLLWLAATWAKGFIGAAALTDPTGLLLVVAVGMGLLFSLAHEDLWDKTISWPGFWNRLSQRFVAGFIFSSLLLFSSSNWAVVANIALHGFVNGGKILNLPFLGQFKYLNIFEPGEQEPSFFKPVKVMSRSPSSEKDEDLMADRLAEVLTRVLLNFSAQEVVDRLNRISHRKYQVQDFTGNAWLEHYAEGSHKIVYRLMCETTQGTAPLNLMVAVKAGKTNTDISSAEWTDLESLSGLTSHTPLFGYFFNDADAYGPLNFIIEEFIEGPTAFEIKQKEGLSEIRRKKIVTALLLIGSLLGRIPHDIHAKNFILRGNGDEETAVMIDLGQERMDPSIALTRLLAFYGHFGEEKGSNRFIFDAYLETFGRDEGLRLLNMNLLHLRQVLSYEERRGKTPGETSLKKKKIREDRNEPALQSTDVTDIIVELEKYLLDQNNRPTFGPIAAALEEHVRRPGRNMNNDAVMGVLRNAYSPNVQQPEKLSDDDAEMLIEGLYRDHGMIDYVEGRVIIATTFRDILKYHPDAVTSDVIRSKLLRALLDFFGLNSDGNVIREKNEALHYNPEFQDDIKDLLKKYKPGPAYRRVETPESETAFNSGQADNRSLKEANITTPQELLDFIGNSPAISTLQEKEELKAKIQDVWNGKEKSDRITRGKGTPLEGLRDKVENLNTGHTKVYSPLIVSLVAVLPWVGPFERIAIAIVCAAILFVPLISGARRSGVVRRVLNRTVDDAEQIARHQDIPKDVRPLRAAQDIDSSSELRQIPRANQGTLRAFTKEFFPNERAALVDSLKKTRELRTDRQDLLIQRDHQIVTLEESDMRKTLSQKALEDYRGLWYVRVLFWVGIKTNVQITLENDIDRLSKECDQLDAELTAIESAIVDINHERAQQDTSSTRDQIKKFYDGSEEDLNHRNVDELSEQDVLILHALKDRWVTDQNSQLLENTRWTTRFHLVRAMRSALSASSFHVGISNRNGLFGNLGVILSKGFIEHAFPLDRGTISDKKGKRLMVGKPSGPARKNITDTLEFSKRNVDHYDEFVVARPEIAGLFLYWDSAQTSSDFEGNYEELLAFAKSVELPLYVIQNGKFYFEPDIEEVRIEHSRAPATKTRRPVFLSPLTAQQVLARTPKPSPTQERKSMERVLENLPFRDIAPKERGRLRNLAQGARDYVNDHAVKFSEKINQDGSLSDLPSPLTQYDGHSLVSKNGVLQWQETNAQDGRIISNPVGAIFSGENGNFRLDPPYFEWIEEVLRLNEREEPVREEYERRLAEENRKSALGLLGYAEQAERMGDHVGRDAAMSEIRWYWPGDLNDLRNGLRNLENANDLESFAEGICKYVDYNALHVLEQVRNGSKIKDILSPTVIYSHAELVFQDDQLFWRNADSNRLSSIERSPKTYLSELNGNVTEIKRQEPKTFLPQQAQRYIAMNLLGYAEQADMFDDKAAAKTARQKAREIWPRRIPGDKSDLLSHDADPFAKGARNYISDHKTLVFKRRAELNSLMSPLIEREGFKLAFEDGMLLWIKPMDWQGDVFERVLVTRNFQMFGMHSFSAPDYFDWIKYRWRDLQLQKTTSKITEQIFNQEREKLGLGLLGYAEEAGRAADVRSQKLVVQFAGVIWPEGSFSETHSLIERRVGPHGEFRGTLNDVESFMPDVTDDYKAFSGRKPERGTLYSPVLVSVVAVLPGVSPFERLVLAIVCIVVLSIPLISAARRSGVLRRIANRIADGIALWRFRRKISSAAAHTAQPLSAIQNDATQRQIFVDFLMNDMTAEKLGVGELNRATVDAALRHAQTLMQPGTDAASFAQGMGLLELIVKKRNSIMTEQESVVLRDAQLNQRLSDYQFIDPSANAGKALEEALAVEAPGQRTLVVGADIENEVRAAVEKKRLNVTVVSYEKLRSGELRDKFLSNRSHVDVMNIRISDNALRDKRTSELLIQLLKDLDGTKGTARIQMNLILEAVIRIAIPITVDELSLAAQTELDQRLRKLIDAQA